MVLWVKSPRVASSDCASNPMRVLFSLTVPLTPLGESSGTGAVRRMRIGIGLLAQSDEATQGDLTQSTIQ